MQPAVIETIRFTLRPLTVADATERYSRWFDDQMVAKHIMAAKSAHDVEALRKYIAERVGRQDVLFLGIFVRESGLHIGNLKFEPIDETTRSATLGIMVGDAEWRGCGVASEVITAAVRWMKDHGVVSTIFLGVDPTNLAAQHAYRKCGFVPVPSEEQARRSDDPIRMVLKIAD